MKHFFLIAALFSALAAAAQPGTPYPNAIKDEGRAPYRTEFMSYDIRKEAEKGEPAGSKYHRPLKFGLNPEMGPGVFEAQVDIPALWLDRDIYIRDGGRTGLYRLWINGREAAVNTSTYAAGDYHVTRYLKEGVNRIFLEFSGDVPGAEMEISAPRGIPAEIKNLYIYSQPRIHVYDYYAAGYRDPEIPDAILALDIIVVNSYNMPETVRVGYDVYDPAGKLKEYTFEEVVIPGRGCDTVRFRNKIFGTEKYRYTADKPSLYKVIISLRHEGRNTEYIPFRVGFGTTRFDGDNILRNDVPVSISAAEYDAKTRTDAVRDLKKMKAGKINTVYVTRPQPQWFYDLCEETGLYVIDRAAVECDPMGDDRGPDGTIANDPAYRDRFVDRQQSMYYRNKNRANVIGWSLGSDSGNGYNMYKSYQWLKQADSTRVVVYPHARGEWNTDTELPAPKQ